MAAVHPALRRGASRNTRCADSVALFRELHPQDMTARQNRVTMVGQYGNSEKKELVTLRANSRRMSPFRTEGSLRRQARLEAFLGQTGTY